MQTGSPSLGPLGTRRFASYRAALDCFYASGWTDGLPVVPPTPDAVRETIAAGHLSPSTVIGSLPERNRELTVAEAAVFAVMAGARPEFFPVVLASWAALFDVRFNLNGKLATTGGAALTAVVSGPYASTIGMNSGTNILGPGNRANSTIGRAVRLGAIVALDARPGVLDASSHGNGGKYSAHFAEATPPEGWLPIRQQLGYPEEATTVTVLPTEAPRQIAQQSDTDPAAVLKALAAGLKSPSQYSAGKGTYYLVILGPEHATILHRAGLTQAEIRSFLAVHSRLSREELEDGGVRIDRHIGGPAGEDGRYPVVDERNLLLVTAGGPGPGWSQLLPCNAPVTNTRPATRPVILPSTAEYLPVGTPEIDFD
jgi:hypothetical protein